MLSRQDSSLSLFRCQAAAATSPLETNRSKAIGCMSGIIQLFCKYRKSNKRITFGRKQHEKCKVMIPPRPCPVKAKATTILPAKEDKIKNQVFDTEKLLSCEVKVPRTPITEQEIQQSSSSESPRTQSPLVARLMGLENYNVINKTTAKKTPVIEEASNVEKRQQLLHALEKCNQDLEELKRILHRFGRLQLNQVVANNRIGENVTKCTDVMVDKFSHRPPISFSQLQTSAVKIWKHQCEPKAIKKVKEEGEPIGNHLLFRKFSTTITKPLLNNMKRQKVVITSPRRTNMAMVQCVEQVCSDLVWGQNRETRRIGLILQDCLWKNLVDELVKEMMKSCSTSCSLPLEGCKMRLCF